MDPIDILGELLGRKSKKPGRDGSALDDLVGNQTRATPGSSAAAGTNRPAANDISGQAKELEDLLGVAQQRATARNTGGAAATGSSSPSAPASRPADPWGAAVGRGAGGAPRTAPPAASGSRSGYTPSSPASTPSSTAPAAWPRREARPEPPRDQNSEAIVLIRAMVHAAKADGEISPAEQQALLAQVGDGSPAALEFLRQEIARPLDVREFAWSVPLGMEQKVYAISLAALRLDTAAEAEYLRDLAHALRLSPPVRRQLHDHYGVPQLDG